MESFKLKENESQNHFIWRVYKFGYATKQLTKEQAGEICSNELCLDFDESAFRKRYEAFEKMWEEVKSEYIGDESEEHIKLLEQKTDELYKMKIRNADYLRLKRIILRDEARFDELKEVLQDSILTLPNLKVNISDYIFEDDNKAVLMLSDLHYGIKIDNYWNVYDTDIAIKRVEKLASDVVKYCNTMSVSDLYLANLNDLISGGLHLTTRLAESIDTVQQAMGVAEVISNMIISIQNKGIKVHYISCTDNHSRRSTNWRESVEGDSWVKIIDEFINLRIGNQIDIIENIFDEQIAYFEIDGKQIFCVHGHRDKPQTVVTNMINATNIIPTHVLMGHYHSKSGFQRANTKVFVNGSIVGVDSYAKDCRYFNKPSQTLIVFDDGNELDIDIKL